MRCLMICTAQKRLRAIPELEDKLTVCQARITAEVDANSKQLDELRTTQV